MPAPSVTLEIARTYSRPLITRGDPGTEDNKYGFEGGTVLRLGDVFHLFTAERAGDPYLVKMRLAHWESRDGLSWRRVSTLLESSGEFTGKDPQAAMWSPMPFFNEQEDRWNLYYVGYRAKPNDASGWYLNYEGRVYRAISHSPGRAGIGGPYEGAEIMLEPGPGSDPWEGLQGTDSFFLYPAQGKWYGFYGSAKTENVPCTYWGLGLASAPTMAGPWKRCSEINPVVMDPIFAENPVVSRLDDGSYFAMIDGQKRIGYATSEDGVSWSEAAFLSFPEEAVWWEDMRTPLCCIPDGAGRFTVFFTAITAGFGGVGRVDVSMRSGRREQVQV